MWNEPRHLSIRILEQHLDTWRAQTAIVSFGVMIEQAYRYHHCGFVSMFLCNIILARSARITACRWTNCTPKTSLQARRNAVASALDAHGIGGVRELKKSELINLFLCVDAAKTVIAI